MLKSIGQHSIAVLCENSNDISNSTVCMEKSSFWKMIVIQLVNNFFTLYRNERSVKEDTWT